MSPEPGHSIKRRFCLGLAGLSVCLGCSSSAENGGSGGMHTGGSPAGAGGAQAGTGGAGGAGGPGSSGATGHGGGAWSCETGECFAANTCLDKCGGSVLYIGCCECEPPSVNQFTCTGTH